MKNYCSHMCLSVKLSLVDLSVFEFQLEWLFHCTFRCRGLCFSDFWVHMNTTIATVWAASWQLLMSDIRIGLQLSHITTTTQYCQYYWWWVTDVRTADSKLWDFLTQFTMHLHPWPHLISELYASSPAEPASQPSGSKRLVVVSQSSFILLWR